MSAQTKYGYNTKIGGAGGIVDIAPYAIDTFLNENETGKLMFGMGVVHGTKAGEAILLPQDASTASDFEGITVNRLTTEHDFEGEISLRKSASIGVMRYGRIYARVAKDIAPKYGDPLYLITSGDEAGYFSNAATNAVAVKGRFMGTVDTSIQIAPVELFNEAQA